jgi:hypothetical protein
MRGSNRAKPDRVAAPPRSIGTFALRFAATAFLFVSAADAQAQGIGQSICRDVWDWGSGKYVHVCKSVYYPPPSRFASPCGEMADIRLQLDAL